MGRGAIWYVRAAMLAFVLSFTMAGVTRKAYYAALSGDSRANLEEVLENIRSGEAGSRAKAYEGGLLMKKAHFEKPPGKKLATFKRGHKLLEAEIAGNPENAEFRFIRLCIQENAPKILKYRNEIPADVELIRKEFPGLPADLKEEIEKYARVSEALKPEVLK